MIGVILVIELMDCSSIDLKLIYADYIIENITNDESLL